MRSLVAGADSGLERGACAGSAVLRLLGLGLRMPRALQAAVVCSRRFSDTAPEYPLAR